jgi:hypothetical protein
MLPNTEETMRTRRILALAIATPVLLAALGATAASAHPNNPGPPSAESQPANIWSKPDANRSHPGHDPQKPTPTADEDMDDGGIVGDLLGHI